MNLFARTLEALDWAFVADALASHSRTAPGRAAAAGLSLLDDPRTIRECFDAVDELRRLEDAGAGSPPVSGVEDLGDHLARARRGDVLDLDDIGAARSTLSALSLLEGFLRRHGAAAPTLARLGSAIALDRRLCATFEGALDDKGRLSEAAWPLLGELRHRIASLERSMQATLECLLESPEYAELLQDRYVTVRDDRFVVPIKAQARNLGLGIVHDASRSERTVFIEPAAVVPMGNERRMAEAELREEERRILAELSAMLGAHAGAIGPAITAAVEIDLVGARARFAAALHAVRPVVERDGVIDLRQARHPVLALSSGGVVANDLRLDAATPVLVLTGPNAGGKTVAMKTIGLCSLLVRAGCFVPAAPGSRVDLFDTVLADVGDMQTVHEGLSSFSAHLTTLRGMLEEAGPGSLLLLDEVAAGTDPAQGGALARAVIERLVEVGARVVATTHFTQVKAMAADDGRVEVAALEYEQGRPTYRVVAGAVGESHALAAARRVGLDEALVSRARELMEEGERALHDALASLESDKQRVAETTRRLEAAEKDLAARAEAVAEKERAIAGRARQLEQRAAAATVEKLREAEEEVRQALSALRADSSRRLADAARHSIAQARDTARSVQSPPPNPSRPPGVGDRVRVAAVGVIGELLAIRGDQAEVRSGSMTVRARLSDLEVVAAAASSPAGSRRTRTEPRAARPSSAPVDPGPEPADWLATAMRSGSNTLDLRGLRVEEGLARLETFLDDSMLEGREVVFVLHGHGTGAMKGATRELLARSAYVAECCPAPEDQGGDALTVSRLRG